MKDPKQAAEAIADFCNNLCFEPGPFVEAMSHQHRTLQQTFTRLCLAWLQHLSKLPEGHYDLRNEASVQIARRLLAGLEEWELHLPLI